MVTQLTARRISMAFIAILAWFALILQLYIMLRAGSAAGINPITSLINFLSYFTILSNLLVAISLSAVLLSPASPIGSFFSNVQSQTAIAVYIFIVGLVYNLVLRDIWSHAGWQLLADNLLHVMVPVAYLLCWFIFTDRKVLKWQDLLLWLIFPAVYLIYSLIRGTVNNWYPYPFLHAGQLGYAKVAINSALILLAFVVAGLGMIVVNKRTKRIRTKS